PRRRRARLGGAAAPHRPRARRARHPPRGQQAQLRRRRGRCPLGRRGARAAPAAALRRADLRRPAHRCRAGPRAGAAGRAAGRRPHGRRDRLALRGSAGHHHRRALKREPEARDRVSRLRLRPSTAPGRLPASRAYSEPTRFVNATVSTPGTGSCRGRSAHSGASCWSRASGTLASPENWSVDAVASSERFTRRGRRIRAGSVAFSKVTSMPNSRSRYVAPAMVTKFVAGSRNTSWAVLAIGETLSSGRSAGGSRGRRLRSWSWAPAGSNLRTVRSYVPATSLRDTVGSAGSSLQAATTAVTTASNATRQRILPPSANPGTALTTTTPSKDAAPLRGIPILRPGPRPGAATWGPGSDVQRPAERGERRFADRFRERRVRVHRPLQLLDRRLQPPADHELADQLARVRADDVRAEDLAVALVADHLDEALGVTGRARPPVRAERERADLDVQPALARLRLRQTHR